MLEKKSCGSKGQESSGLPRGTETRGFFTKRRATEKKRNQVHRLVRPDGTFCVDSNELEVMTREFYENLYTSEETIGIEEVLSHVPRKVTDEMNVKLDA